MGTAFLGSRALGISVLFRRFACHLLIQMFLFMVSLLTVYNSLNTAHQSFLRNRDLWQVLPRVLFICLAFTVLLSWNSN